MRAATLCAAMALSTPSLGIAADAAWTIRASEKQSLQASLLAIAQERLAAHGVFVDGDRAWLSLSGPLPPGAMLEVRAGWTADSGMPSLPLTFELRRAGGAALQARLTVPLLREVGLAQRRLRKGSVVTCADVGTQRRNIRNVPAGALPLPCELASNVVALRDVAAGDVLRSADIGRAPDVAAGAPVHVHVAWNGIHVTATAVALADANAGDQIDVRLKHPTRTLRARVTGPATAHLVEASP